MPRPWLSREPSRNWRRCPTRSNMGERCSVWASIHRKAKRKGAARDALERSEAIFSGLGARLWAEKAAAELRRISGRRRGSVSLTETEERVARLAAKGRSNKQIAAELLMSVHTVGAHLSQVYRKLGISSRSELHSNLAGAAAATESARPRD